MLAYHSTVKLLSFPLQYEFNGKPSKSMYLMKESKISLKSHPNVFNWQNSFKLKVPFLRLCHKYLCFVNQKFHVLFKTFYNVKSSCIFQNHGGEQHNALKRNEAFAVYTTDGSSLFQNTLEVDGQEKIYFLFSFHYICNAYRFYSFEKKSLDLALSIREIAFYYGIVKW